MRSSRTCCDANVYHVIGRGVGRQLIFEDDKDKDFFVTLMKKSIEASDGELYAWCLMTNHFHLLVTAPLQQLSTYVKALCGGYAQYFNKRHGRTGHLFQERYKSEPVTSDAYFFTVVRYIHFNPVKGGLSKTPDYRWSSFRELREAGDDSPSRVIELFGGIEQFLAFHEQDDDGFSCLDIESNRLSKSKMRDAAACDFAKELTGVASLCEIASMDRKTRNGHLVRLKEAGFSIRQIERLTGIGRNVIANAK